MNQSELARHLQVSSSAVGMYEQGRREPSAETLVAISRIFGVSVDYLLTGKGSFQEKDTVALAMESALSDAQVRLDKRPKRPLSRQELAVLFAALLMDA